MEQLIDVYKDKGRKGIANIGCTCYVNTAIQCLSHCLCFLDYVLQLRCENTSLMYEFQDVLRILWNESQGIIPRRFLNKLQISFGDLLHIRDQNDIHEFLGIFIDKLNDSIGTRINNDDLPPNRRLTPLQRFHKLAEKSWLNSHRLSYSPLCEMFYGQQVNQITCKACSGISHIFDTIGSIMISFDENTPTYNPNQPDTVPSIGELIGRTLCQEEVQERECDICNKKASGTKTHKFYKLPKILIVNIKRHGRFIGYPVRVPEVLDISSVCISEDNHGSYDLVSIACHVGSMNSGHYYAVCKHPDSKWYVYDDDSVKHIESYSSINPSSYYTLFFQCRNFSI